MRARQKKCFDEIYIKLRSSGTPKPHAVISNNVADEKDGREESEHYPEKEHRNSEVQMEDERDPMESDPEEDEEML